MAFFEAMNISASGLTAQRLRLDVISENITHAQTTRTLEGGPYQRKTVIFEEIRETPFTQLLQRAMGIRPTEGDGNARSGGMGVRVPIIVRDQTPGPLIFDPAHPDANADGYVRMPNVNMVAEMVDMIAASRSYEANITAINVTQALMTRTLEISRN